MKQVFVFCLWAFQDQPLGNWRMKRQVDSEDEVIYKFSPKFVLKAGQTVTVSNVKWLLFPSPNTEENLWGGDKISSGPTYHSKHCLQKPVASQQNQSKQLTEPRPRTHVFRPQLPFWGKITLTVHVCPMPLWRDSSTKLGGTLVFSSFLPL